MSRLHLLELEDQAWLPAMFRDGMRAYLAWIIRVTGQADMIMPVIVDQVRKHKVERIVDLCSGGGGPVDVIVAGLQAEGIGAEIVVTDLFPDAEAGRMLADDSRGQVQLHPEPVDARDVPDDLEGMRVIFNAFHHFRPMDARRIMADAAMKRQPLTVVEFVSRAPLVMLPMPFFMPFMVALSSPLWKPFRWTNIIFSLLIPILPFLVLWDGLVSCLRVYTEEELLALAKDIDAPDYRWTVTRIPLGPPGVSATLLLGEPI